MNRISLGVCVALFSTTAWAGRVDVAGVSASSVYPPTAKFKYHAAQVNDGKLATGWVEGEKGSGLGSWVQMDLGTERAVYQVKIWAGDWYSYDLWQRQGRPKLIEIKFSDGSVEQHELADEMKAQVLTLNSVRKTTSIRIKVKDIYKGNTFYDTAIAEVQVYDKTNAKHAEVNTYNVSSELPADGDGNYSPKNMHDGINDSMWCEGNMDGDGVGEWIEFDFGGQKKVGSLTLVNGIGSSMMVWMKGNRMTEAKLDFADGSSENLVIKNSYRPQTIKFSPRTTSKIKLTVKKVMKGKEYNDLCLSEARFSP